MPEYTMINLPCPVCGFLCGNRDTCYGTYDICQICDWKDDGVQFRFPAYRGGANHYSLYEEQIRMLGNIPINVKELKGKNRSDEWRPLSEDEIEFIKANPDKQFNDLDKPYWKNDL